MGTIGTIGAVGAVRSSQRTSGSTAADLVIASILGEMTVLLGGWADIVLHSIETSNLHTHDSGVDLLMLDQEDDTETNLGQHVENSVKNHLAVWSDDVTAVSDTPSNWVECP